MIGWAFSSVTKSSLVRQKKWWKQWLTLFLSSVNYKSCILILLLLLFLLGEWLLGGSRTNWIQINWSSPYDILFFSLLSGQAVNVSHTFSLFATPCVKICHSAKFSGCSFLHWKKKSNKVKTVICSCIRKCQLWGQSQNINRFVFRYSTV